MHLLLRRTAQRLLQAYLTEQVEVERYKSEMIPRAARASSFISASTAR